MPVKRGIKKPRNLATLSSRNKTGRHLMEAMNLASLLGKSEFHTENEFSHMKTRLREAFNLFLDLDKKYSEQDEQKWKEAMKYVYDKCKFLEEYEDFWPARAYLGQYLSQKGKGSKGRMGTKQNVREASVPNSTAASTDFLGHYKTKSFSSGSGLPEKLTSSVRYKRPKLEEVSSNTSVLYSKSQGSNVVKSDPANSEYDLLHHETTVLLDAFLIKVDDPSVIRLFKGEGLKNDADLERILKWKASERIDWLVGLQMKGKITHLQFEEIRRVFERWAL